MPGVDEALTKLQGVCLGEGQARQSWKPGRALAPPPPQFFRENIDFLREESAPPLQVTSQPQLEKCSAVPEGKVTFKMSI